jgi:hypothetical protein
MNRRVLPVVLAAGALLSAGLASTAAADMRVGRNQALRPSSDPVYGRDAVGLAVNPRNPDHIVAVYTDLDTLGCEVASTLDGGRRWRRTRLTAPAGFVAPACTVGRHLAALLDQSIAFGRGNNVYTTFSSATVDPSGEPGAKSALVVRSRDGGRTFGTGVVALRAGATLAAGPDYTLPQLTVRPGGKGRADRVFVVAGDNEQNPSAGGAREDSILAVSRDSGLTWSGPQRINPLSTSSIEPSQPVLGRGNALYVAWRTHDKGAAPGAFLPEGRVVVSRSTDLGATWTHSTAAGVHGYVYQGPPAPPFVTVQTFSGSAFPRIAADRRSGKVYLVYGNGGQPTQGGSAVAADHFIHPDSDVWFQRSSDGAATWSAPKRLNGQAPLEAEITQTRHPSVSVAPDGRVDVVWQDRRHWYRGCPHTHAPCTEGRLGDTYYRYSRDGGVRWAAEHRISDRSTNNDVGFDYRYGTYWAYGPQSVPLGKNRLLVAWMDSRNGNTETDTQDIYLAKVNLKASRRIPTSSIRTRSARDLAVGLSRLAWPGGGEGVLAGVFASRPWSRVVIVNERDYAGALASGVLGRANLGPVLLAPSRGLTPAVKAEVSRLAPIGAYLIGSQGALSPQVAADLAATGIPADQIVRIAAATPAATAALVAGAMDKRTAAEKQAAKPAFDAAVIVNPASPDAAAATVLAADRRLPVLFADATSLPAETSGALASLRIASTLVVGGTKWIGSSVMAQLPQPARLGGKDALATSRAVMAESVRRGLPTNIVFSSNRRMDAAVMGAPVARIGALLMLSRGGAAGAGAVLGDMGMRSNVDQLVLAEKPRKRGGR